jgi:hypothetical protein
MLQPGLLGAHPRLVADRIGLVALPRGLVRLRGVLGLERRLGRGPVCPAGRLAAQHAAAHHMHRGTLLTLSAPRAARP